MTAEERAAYIHAQAVAAQVEAFGMMAENFHRMHRGESIAYRETEFNEIINRYSLHSNNLINFLRD